MRAGTVLLLVLVTACATAPRGASFDCTVLPSERGSTEAARNFLERCGLSEAIELTRALVAFRTVSAEGLAHENPGFAEMKQYLQAWAGERGFEFQSFGADDAWELRLGQGPRRVGYVMHADVVPAGEGEVPEGWSGAPFSAWIQDGKLYGRGTEDDKGPIAAVLVALHTLARFGLVPNAQLVAILGTAEEKSWDGMVRYAQTSTKPEHVVSIDASYPVVIAESGFVAWKVALPLGSPRPVDAGDRPRIERAQGGQFLTQVPGEATMTVLPARGEHAIALAHRLEPLGQDLAKTMGPGFELDVRTAGPRVIVRARGRAVHSSEAERGDNALWLLARVAAVLDPEPNAVSRMLGLIDRHFVLDHHGQRLGLDYAHPLMGRLLVSPTLLDTGVDSVSLGINMRRPAGRSKAEFEGVLDIALARLQAEESELTSPERWVGEPALADTSGPLVSTLMELYRKTTGDRSSAPISIRGGTYARLFPGAVSFGPSMPGRTYTGHGPNEHIELEVLERMVRMIFESALKLGAER